ncbi:uncharacterized protein LOC106673487 isoform X2 [Cimex lectularius]|nr:uncharacterized protein LOC106673487 isoform X2 [Cimex lectularius]
MEVNSMKWYATVVLVICFTSQENILLTEGVVIPANIPDYLLECYNNSYILTKDNLLPMTVNSLISLIRKIEDTVSTSMDMRTLVPAILSRFRFDGIERNPNINPQQYVIPYGPNGPEFFLFRTLFQQVLPNVGSSFPNDTLSYVERCTLHWMLSNSIDIWDHGDNSASCPTSHQFYNGQRYPRDLSKIGESEVFDLNAIKPQGRIMTGSKGYYQQNNFGPIESACPIENGIIYSVYGDISPGTVLAGISAGLNPQRSPPRNLYKAQPRGLRRKPTQPPDYRGRPRGGYNPPFNNGGDGYGGYPGYGGGGNNPGIGYPSDPGYGYGPNGVGPQDIDSKYAATLAGQLSYIALLQGPESNKQIPMGGSGNWNSTLTPKYYFLNNYYKYMVTDARIRGSLDGMILADNIQNWVSLGRGNLKLSQVLSMYYSQKGVFGTDIKACNRKGYFEKYTHDLGEQAFSMAEVLKDDLPPSVTVKDEGIHEYTDESVQILRSYIPTLPDLQCVRDDTNSSVQPTVDLHVVVDCSWNFLDIVNLLLAIGEKCDLRKYGGNLTVINAKDGTVMIESAQSIMDLGTQFNSSMYTTKPMGLDLTKVLSMLRHRFKDKADYDKQQNSAGGIARIVVIIPSMTASVPDNDANNAKSILQYFKENIPDVTFLYLVQGSKDKWNPFAIEPRTDVILYNLNNPVAPLINRLMTVPRIIINPTCGRYWSGYWYNEVSLKGYLDNSETHFYKISTNYFFREANAKITISTDTTTPTLNFCMSRTNPMPVVDNSKSGDVTCQQITTGNRYSFTIPKDVCTSVYYVAQCNPYYFSVSNNQRGSQISITCNDPDCRDPDLVKYTISHQGLSCYSGVSQILMSPAILIFVIFINLNRYF